MESVTFTPAGPTFNIPFTATASNVALGTQSTGQNTLYKIDNSSGNLAFVTFATSAATANAIDHPTPGSPTNSIAIRTGATTLVNPGLGIYSGPVYVGAISVSGTGNIYIQPGI